jgi:hypothetical protein
MLACSPPNLKALSKTPAHFCEPFIATKAEKNGDLSD